MLLDDVELDNFIHQKLIEMHYFSKHVYVSLNAEEALNTLNGLVQSSPNDESLKPAVIFIDINMPLTDGFEFAIEFKKSLGSHFEKTKLAILTSSLFEKDKKEALHISEDIVFLQKPLTKEMLNIL